MRHPKGVSFVSFPEQSSLERDTALPGFLVFDPYRAASLWLWKNVQESPIMLDRYRFTTESVNNERSEAVGESEPTAWLA